MSTPHPLAHWMLAAGLIAAQAILILVVRNRAVRRRLLFSAAVATVAAILHLAAGQLPGVEWLGGVGVRIEQLLLAFSMGTAGIALLFNPWFADGRSARAPAIVQDTFIVVFVCGAAAIVFSVSSFNVLTGSAIVAAVLGFALQETLGNAFAGIAIQIERPFRVGHWIAAGEHVGRVTEVTWRATKILTKAGNLTIVPNSQMAAHAIQNYSEPSTQTRIEVEVGADYRTPPNEVRAAMLAATREARYVLSEPPPEALVWDFGASAITYRIRFWIDDFSQDGRAKDAVRTRIYYEFRRRNIEIPWPIQVQYAREEAAADTPMRREGFARAIAGVPVLARLPSEAHQALASSARELRYADGEVIVGQGDAGASMFLVLRGAVAITIGAERREVALTPAGGYFGEMSLLTGEPRTATVIARGDCTALEISADSFRSWVQGRPEVIDELALAAGARRKELEEARAASGSAPLAPVASLRDRMREFFGIR